MSYADIPQFTVLPPEMFDISDAELHVRLFTGGDASSLLALANEPNVQRFVPWAKQVHDLASAEAMLLTFRSSWERKVLARYAVEKDAKIIGYCGLWRDQVPGYYEYGFAILPELRGQGIGSRILAGIINVVRNDLDGRGMISYIHDDNEPSKRVALKLGFRPTSQFDKGDRRYELDFNTAI